MKTMFFTQWWHHSAMVALCTLNQRDKGSILHPGRGGMHNLLRVHSARHFTALRTLDLTLLT